MEQKAGLTSTNEALEKEVTVCMQLDVHAYNEYYTYIHNFDIFTCFTLSHTLSQAKLNILIVYSKSVSLHCVLLNQKVQSKGEWHSNSCFEETN